MEKSSKLFNLMFVQHFEKPQKKQLNEMPLADIKLLLFTEIFVASIVFWLDDDQMITFEVPTGVM